MARYIAWVATVLVLYLYLYEARTVKSGNPVRPAVCCLTEECLALVGESTPLTMLLPH